MKKREYDLLQQIQKKLSKGRKTKIALSLAISHENKKSYVACGFDGVVIFDITDTPRQVGSFKTNGYAFSIVLSDDDKRAYIADGANGIVVKDVSDLNAIKNIPTFVKTGQIIDLKISNDGTKAYAVNHEEGLIVYKMIENIPYNIELDKIASYSMPYCYHHNFTIQDKTIFACTENGIDILELCDDKIVIKEQYDMKEKVNRVILSENNERAYAISSKKVIVLSVEKNSIKKVIKTNTFYRSIECIIVDETSAYAKIGKDLIKILE